MIQKMVMTIAAGEAQRVSGRRWVPVKPSSRALFVLVVALHWVEHLVQAVQIHALGTAPAQALGAVGALFPGLVRSEWLHLAYNLALLAGLVVLHRLFTSRGRRLWHLAIAGQSWHLFEHLLLFAQAQTGARFFGTDAPSSVLQLFVPRADLHLTYNGVVTLLMVFAAFDARRSAQWAARLRPEWSQVDVRGAIHRLFPSVSGRTLNALTEYCAGDRHKERRTARSELLLAPGHGRSRRGR